jgi:hypothetical protein
VARSRDCSGLLYIGRGAAGEGHQWPVECDYNAPSKGADYQEGEAGRCRLNGETEEEEMRRRLHCNGRSWRRAVRQRQAGQRRQRPARFKEEEGTLVPSWATRPDRPNSSYENERGKRLGCIHFWAEIEGKNRKLFLNFPEAKMDRFK